MGHKGLLDELARQTGCIYLSELREEKRKLRVKEILPGMIDKDYELREWNEVISYIYEENRKFSTEKEALDYVLKQTK